MLLCNTSGQYYIGSSTNLENRLKQYYSPVVRQNKDFIIYRAINKYGLDNFSPGGRVPLNPGPGSRV
jgi:group I intron endonuclease